MKNGYYVYRFKDENNNIIYVGKTTNLDQRFKKHEHLTKNVKSIEYIEYETESDMSWKEIYYINLYKNDKTTNIASIYNGKPKEIEFGDKWLKYKAKNKKQKEQIKLHIDNVKDPDEKYVIYVKFGVIDRDFIVSDYNTKTNEFKIDVYLSEAQLFTEGSAYFITKKLNDLIIYNKETNEYEYKYYDALFFYKKFLDYRLEHKVQNYLLEEQGKMNDIMKKHNKDFNINY